MTRLEIIDEAERSFGFVPGFIEDAPDSVLIPLWGAVRDLFIRDTEIPLKYKALILLGTGAFLRDHYISHAAKEFALTTGASDMEIKEALAVAGDTALGSTWLNGYRFDLDKFEKEVHNILKNVEKQETVPVRGRLDTREDVLNDVNNVLGIVPDWLNEIPDMALKHIWRLLRGVEFEETLIPSKYKSLISLAVASTIPCRYCTLFDTEGARTVGATDNEIKEAILIAGVAHFLGTMLDGMHYDLESFTNDSRKMVAGLTREVRAEVL